MNRTIAVITSYPPRGTTHDRKIVGGASYTKTLFTKLSSLAKSLRFVIYPEVFDSSSEYGEGGLLVKRLWQKDNPLSLMLAMRDVWKTSQIIAVSFEIKMMGGMVNTLFFLLLLAISRLMGKTIIFMPHQVVDRFDALESNVLKRSLLNLGASVLNLLISTVSTRIVVFEASLGRRLPDQKKVVVIPLAVEQDKPQDKTVSRKQINLAKDTFYLLYFGFLSPYKGLSELLDVLTDRKGIQLIVAGDANTNHAKNSSYMEYVTSVKKKASDKKAVLRGFIPEADIPVYYSACDLIILPYRMFFSSSYPLSLAFTYEKPVLLSPALADYFEDTDFQFALKETGLTKDDFVISFHENNMYGKIKNVKENYDRFAAFSKIIKDRRNIEKIAQKYIHLFESI